MNINDKVALAVCGEYDIEKINESLFKMMEELSIKREEIEGKRVIIKPNLLLAYPPEKAATTHPNVITSVALLCKKLGASEVIIAESPGGIYNEKNLDKVYRVTGMKQAASDSGAKLNYDLGWKEFSIPNGVVSKTVNVINPIYDADVIINVCKMKTHSLAVMTCASKNLFGVIPGIMKFEMHARFKKPEDFFTMVVDLNEELAKRYNIIHICDGIVGMEGDGPSGGTPKQAGAILMSRSPFNLDLVASEIMGLGGRVKMLKIAAKRLLCPERAEEVEIVYNKIEDISCGAFIPPDTAKGKKFDLIPPFLQPRPVIDIKLCRGCKMCVESCPQSTIIMKNGRAKINHDKCIRCYCCQELCTFKAVKIKKSFIYRLVE